MSNALVLHSVAETVALVASGRVKLDELGTALMAMPEEDARERLQALPVKVQSTVVRLAIGGSSEAPLLCLMKTEEAATAVMLDGAMFEETSLYVDVTRADEDTELEDIMEERSRREVVIVDPKGNRQVVPIYLNPERAWVYFQTIARHPDQAWREEVMEHLGIALLAYLYASVEKGDLDVDLDDWDECMNLCDDDYRQDALTMGKRNSAEKLEDDLIELHAASMCQAFQLPEDFMKNPEVAAASATDLAESLDLG